MPKVQLGVRVESAVKKAIDKVAKEERRSLSVQVEIALEEWLAQRKRRSSTNRDSA